MMSSSNRSNEFIEGKIEDARLVFALEDARHNRGPAPAEHEPTTTWP